MVRVLTMEKKCIWIEIMNIVNFSPKRWILLDNSIQAQEKSGWPKIVGLNAHKKREHFRKSQFV